MPKPEGDELEEVKEVKEAAELVAVVEGKFHANAPATLKLPAGSHTIVLKSPGLAGYTRTLGAPSSRKGQPQSRLPEVERR